MLKPKYLMHRSYAWLTVAVIYTALLHVALGLTTFEKLTDIVMEIANVTLLVWVYWTLGYITYAIYWCYRKQRG